VGYITGLNGLAMVAIAPFCGWWADQHRRDRMLRVAGVVGILMAVASMVGVLEGHYPLLCACLVGWGVYGGIQSPAMEALFADSVEPGERSKVFTVKYSLTQLASAVGPLLSLVMFGYLGDEWELPQCQHVIVAGLILCLFPSLLCYLFDDDKTFLSHSPQSVERRRREHAERMVLARQASAGNDEAPSKALTAPLLSAPDGAGMLAGVAARAPGATGEPWQEAEAGPDSGRAVGGGGCCCRPAAQGSNEGFCAKNYVPSVIVATDICFALASGISVKFFPLFFMQTYNLSPMMVSLIYVLSPLATALSSFVAQRASRRLGRVATTIFFKVCVCWRVLLGCVYVYMVDCLMCA
jgi:MFS family permease